ncbi:MAG: GMC oxidoreductase [Candidatus Binataceae bacterium]
MKPQYDAIVIGTGFGGAVSACRLAQANLQVGIFERGHRYPPAPFPRDAKDIMGGWLWQFGRGLFDIRALSEMTTVQAAGYGGGSLIYANVQMCPPRSAFNSGWPSGYSLEALAPYYALVSYMLDVKPITAASAPPPKTALMKQAASRQGRLEQFFYPNLAIDFGTPGEIQQNRFGAPQAGCNFCGECIVGCRNKAKNTLDLNYLKVAENLGADINTDCEVTRIEPLEGGGYKVTVVDHASGTEATSQAAQVFLCAGAINSTELLLRCRDEHGTLPKLSQILGHRYSGNGDFIAFSFDNAQAFEPSNGPTITSALLYDRAIGDYPVWFLVEDGGYPKELSALVHLLHPKAALFEELHEARMLAELREAVKSAIASMPVGVDESAEHERTAVFLLMGRDRAAGVIKLASPAPGIFIDWDVHPNLPLYDTETELSADFAAALKGSLELNPLWKVMRTPVSVHNLGGCPMADMEGMGVVNPFGEVFEYPGLYVLDGSILPGSTGANPSHTIAAVAERNIEAAIRKIRNDSQWQAPQMPAAMQQVIPEPLDNVTVPAGGTAPPSKSPVQLTFNETLRGYVSTTVEPGDYNGGDRAGREVGDKAEMTLTITTPALDSFMADRRYTATVQGAVKIPGITPPEGAAVRNGIFHLFVGGREGQFYRRTMLYHLPFRGNDGNPYVLEGFKDVRDHGGFDVWSATTTLYTSVRAADGKVVASGILRVLLPDFLKQLTTFRVKGTDNILVKTSGLARFFALFVGTLIGVFLRPRMPGAT